MGIRRKKHDPDSTDTKWKNIYARWSGKNAGGIWNEKRNCLHDVHVRRCRKNPQVAESPETQRKTAQVTAETAGTAYDPGGNYHLESTERVQYSVHGSGSDRSSGVYLL